MQNYVLVQQYATMMTTHVPLLLGEAETEVFAYNEVATRRHGQCTLALTGIWFDEDRVRPARRGRAPKARELILLEEGYAPSTAD